MFGLGWPEIGVVLVVGLLVFGPDRLPDMARQAAGFVRTIRQMADNAKRDLSNELGSEFGDLKLSSLDPREIVRQTLADADDDVPAAPVNRALRPGERAPFDPDAT